MFDKDKIFSKIDLLNDYIDKLESIKPTTFEEYVPLIEKKMACERLLQISIECIIDICNIIVANMGLGLPSDEETLIKKLEKEKIISLKLSALLKEMIGFRNILVHKYGEVEDEKVFENLGNLNDLEKFKEEILRFLKNYPAQNERKKVKTE